MSSYPNNAPPGTTSQGGDAFSAAWAGGDLSGFVDESGMNGLDLDLPMEMNVDIGSGAQEDFNTFPPGQSSHQAVSYSPAQGLMSGSIIEAGDGTHQRDANEAGAGPLPTGFGMPAQTNGGTSLSEFTKRRNWSQRVLEEVKDFLHILTPDGRILYVSPSCETLTGYNPQSLVGKFIGEYVHPDDSGIFMREFNESIASGNALRFFYRFKREDGTYLIFECDGHPHISSEPADVQATNMSSVTKICRGFFMMARPYPTKNAALLDSFLEHKLENERLMKRIAELKSEEAEENAEQDRLYREHRATPATQPPAAGKASNTRGSTDNVTEAASSTPNYQGMPPPAKPTVSNTQLTQQNLNSATSAHKPEGIADKMSRYEAKSTHLEGIELMTGLRYTDGERSHGLSTGDSSPALIRGDAGIAILMDRDREGQKRDKRKMKIADEYVCSDCGTLDSPEWRKGPKGPKTLCNACGLRWAKKEKKRSPEGGSTMSPLTPSGPQSGGNGAEDLGRIGGGQGPGSSLVREQSNRSGT